MEHKKRKKKYTSGTKRSSYRILTDGKLIDLFKLNKEKKAFGELYKRYKDTIYNYVCRFLYKTPKDIAGEIMHDIFIKVYLELSILKNPEAFKAWLFKIARTCCLKYIRKNKYFHYNFDPTDTDDNNSLDLTDNRVNIESDFINNEIQSRIYKEINKLDFKIKEIIIFKYFEDLTYEQISDILKIPPTTIQYKLKKALNALSKKLKAEDYI